MGALGLVAYAKCSYQVELTVDQADAFRAKLIHEICSERAHFLAEDPMAVLVHNVGASSRELREAFDRDGARPACVALAIKKIVRGKTVNASGKSYSSSYLEKVWSTLFVFARTSN